MPFTVAEGAVLGAGMLFAGGATMAYRHKQTRAFKLLYFLSWPTLGSALMWTLMPSEKQMEQELRQSGTSQEQIDARRAATQAQLEQLKAAAAAGKDGSA